MLTLLKMQDAVRLLLVLLCCATAGLTRAQTAVNVQRIWVDTFGRAHVVVASNQDNYYVLHATNPGDAGAHAVAIRLGAADSLTLLDPLPALPTSAYSVASYPLLQPVDTDGDGMDDVAELRLADTVSAPLNAARHVANALDGRLKMLNQVAFMALARASSGDFTYLAGAAFLKIYITQINSDTAGIYFQNVNLYERHEDFAAVANIPVQSNGGKRPGDMRGTLVFHPEVLAANGKPGLYTFQFPSIDDFDFETIQRAQDLIAANMPFLKANLAFRPLSERARDNFAAERSSYESSRIHVVSEEELLGDLSYFGLHEAVGYGLLTLGDIQKTPTPFEIVVYDELPNTLPRVAGIISSVAQTPLSHVNLRAIQDNLPNAYLRNALVTPALTDFIGKYVRLEVLRDTFFIREATSAEVDVHFASVRPTSSTALASDLSLREIQDLDQLGFADGIRVGAKAANLAELRRIVQLRADVPDGYAIPFSFYDDFVRNNGFDRVIADMLVDPAFRADFAEQERQLKDLRVLIERGVFSPEAYAALSALQQNFPAGTPIRCRSSTNGEDLPGFSGAGLYDSKTQRPDEGHIAKSIKEVYASLWNFRAFVEREFYRIDHLSAYMGVLVHPNFDQERVNGVGVSFDPLYNIADRYYINTQIGEELITTPRGRTVPEELLIQRDSSASIAFQVLRRSNLVPFGERVLERAYIDMLRADLTAIHEHFTLYYQPRSGERYAMEIEFKVDRHGQFVIKQARPWAAFRREFVSVPELIPRSVMAVTAYPNPFVDKLSLKVDLPHFLPTSYLSLYDTHAKEVLRKRYPAPQHDAKTLNLDAVAKTLATGTYTYALRDDQGRTIASGLLIKVE